MSRKITLGFLIFIIFSLTTTFVIAGDGTTTLNAHGPAAISIEVPDSVDFGEIETGENYFNTDKSIRVDINNTGNTDIIVSLDFESGYEGIFENTYVSETKTNPDNDYLYSDFELLIDAPSGGEPGHEWFYIWLDLTNVTEQIGYENQQADLIYTAISA
ncbi:MAG: hypothetical protein KC516_00870 [Nanoarchaeota archaeon]|nr:hypothetical protein [Nanoarchaeota archaeon]